MSWSWKQFWKNVPRGLKGGLIFGLIAGLLSSASARSSELRLSSALILGLFSALIFGLIRGLLGRLTDKVKGEKALPNEGIKLSGKNGTIAAVIGCVLFGSIPGLIIVLAGGGLRVGLVVGLIVWLTFGLPLGLNRGGSAAVKHYSLRLTLWLCRYTPIRFIRFLDYCSTLILLKKVGGGYIFIHRMLLEYFAMAEF
jgi:hypothetical protein